MTRPIHALSFLMLAMACMVAVPTAHAAGAQHGTRAALPGAAPVDGIGRDIIGFGEAVARAERCGQIRERFHGGDPRRPRRCGQTG